MAIRRQVMTASKHDEWIVDHWRLESRWHPLDFEEPIQDLAPPLWKDLTLGAVTAALLWVAAVALLA
jgi:hypothetical protein